MKTNLSEKEMATIQICLEAFIKNITPNSDEADKEVAHNANVLLGKIEDAFTRNHKPKRECIHCGRKTTQFVIDEKDQIVCIPCGRHY